MALFHQFGKIGIAVREFGCFFDGLAGSAFLRYVSNLFWEISPIRADVFVAVLQEVLLVIFSLNMSFLYQWVIIDFSFLIF